MSSQVIRLGCDPGGTTGVAIFRGTTLIHSDAIGGALEGFKEWWYESGHLAGVQEIVTERFVPMAGLGGMTQAYSPQIEGAIKMVWDGPLTLQLRSSKATLFRQYHEGRKGERERKDWLASKGLHFETTHAMDAATHVLVERKNAKDMAFWKRYWK